MLRELKNVGCRSIELGIENFSDNILRYYNKKINERVIIDAITLLQDENIHIDVDYILFSPVVTFRELKYNVEKLIEHNFTNKNYIDIPFSSLVLFTGTKLRSIYHKEKDLSVIDIERFIKDKDVLIIYKIMKRLKLNYYDIIKNIIYDDFWKNDFKELNIIADVLFFKIERIFMDFLYYLIENIKEMKVADCESGIYFLYNKAVDGTRINSLILCCMELKKFQIKDIYSFIDILLKEKIIFEN